jgi:hypothetical protein
VPALLVVVTGGKSGPGATTLAVGLAGALAAEGKDVLLADLDPAGGEVAAHLPAEPHRGLLPLLSLTGGPVSPDQVAAESVTVGEHLWVLPGLPRSEPAGGECCHLRRRGRSRSRRRGCPSWRWSSPMSGACYPDRWPRACWRLPILASWRPGRTIWAPSQLGVRWMRRRSRRVGWCGCCWGAAPLAR